MRNRITLLRIHIQWQLFKWIYEKQK
jgi:hypothetical protein